MPGKQIFAPHIEKINPIDCCAYSNVVIMCGINDVRAVHVKCQSDVRALYFDLKQKIKQIQCINKRANIFICPILPTNLYDLNRRAVYFNGLINNDLLPSNLGVTYVNGFSGLLDQ